MQEPSISLVLREIFCLDYIGWNSRQVHELTRWKGPRETDSQSNDQ